MIKIRQILFVPPAPIVWAEHLRLFAKHAVEVDTTQTASSDQLGQGLADGTWDVGIGVVDNIIAWNQERNAGLQIFAQYERTTVMAFCAHEKYRTLADTANASVAVDATTNGFVLVHYRALARAGVDWRKCRYEPVGGVRHRFEALAAGKADATVLVPPFIDMALAKGFRKLWSGEDIAPAYPGVVAAARADWLHQNQDAVRRYLGSLLEANEWAAQPRNAGEAVSSLVAARYSEPAAKRLVRDIVPGLEPSLAGWEEVVALRRECGLLPNPAPKAAEVIHRGPWTT